MVHQVASALQQAKAFDAAEKWLAERAVPLIDKLPEAARKENLLSLRLIRGTLYLEQGRRLRVGSPERRQLMDQSIAEYDAIWQTVPGHFVAGNNLAWLLVKERAEPARALAVIEEVRKGKYSRKPVGGERLPLEFLDTIGAVYRATDRNQDAVALFKEAMQRYEKEPRVIMPLGQAQAGMGLKKEAYESFKIAIELAGDRIKKTIDPDRKEKLKQLMDDARVEQRKLNLVGSR
jgi:hypothetical protein